MKNKVEIISEDGQGKKVTIFVARPTNEDYRQSQAEANKAFKIAIASGALLRQKLDDYMRRENLWDDEKEKELTDINKQINDKIAKLKAGGIKLSEARKLAIDIRMLRADSVRLSSKRRELDEYTVEAQAENAKFDYLVYACTKNEAGERVFSNIDNYKERAAEPYAIKAASTLASMIYGLSEDWEKNLPENEFLKKYNFVDDDLRLINKDGKFVTLDGKLIDEEYRYVNEQGQYVDRDGNLVDKDGFPLVESKPFLDDEGNPLVEEDTNKKVEELKV